MDLITIVSSSEHHHSLKVDIHSEWFMGAVPMSRLSFLGNLLYSGVRPKFLALPVHQLLVETQGLEEAEVEAEAQELEVEARGREEEVTKAVDPSL